MSVEDLDYYGDDFSGDSAEYQMESNNSRGKRSPNDYEDIYSLLTTDVEESERGSGSGFRSERVNTSRGELTGLEPCTEYGLTVVTVFPHKINVTSREEIFRTLCSQDCPTNTTDLVVSEATNTTTGQPAVWLEILTPPDCLSGSSFVLTICTEDEAQCESSQEYKDRQEKIELTNLRGLSQLQLQPCTNYS